MNQMITRVQSPYPAEARSASSQFRLTSKITDVKKYLNAHTTNLLKFPIIVGLVFQRKVRPLCTCKNKRDTLNIAKAVVFCILKPLGGHTRFGDIDITQRKRSA